MSLREIYDLITEQDAINTLRKYTSYDMIEMIKEEIDIRKLGAFISWFEKQYEDIHIIDIYPVYDVDETGDFIFVEIDLYCDENGNLELSKEVKAYMREQGFTDLAGHVALICKD